MPSLSRCLEEGPGSRPDDAIRIKTVFLLETGHRDVRFRTVVAVDGDAMACAAQGSLDFQDIPSLERRALEPELPHGLGRRYWLKERSVGSRPDDAGGRDSIDPLIRPDCGRSGATIDAVHTNREIMAAQELLHPLDLGASAMRGRQF